MIMVDEFRKWGITGIRCFQHGSCHLTTDGQLDELHAFAARIGLRRGWFQVHGTPHYDLTPARRAKALALGAVFVPAKVQARRRLALRRSKTTAGIGPAGKGE